ncbi:hypothetical protein PCASD_17074 [Puccinia coronata f. sp. avenae]|uniref:PIG-P domain-containing protein n=1 Tax=Puccinia coronata f. sp. avenae TaxID=200324 RepID=A0A2N5TR73_9BASI|nr:hypothetical protein PCASD_17074 [Puccinia coronata f. sp. avenae]
MSRAQSRFNSDDQGGDASGDISRGESEHAVSRTEPETEGTADETMDSRGRSWMGRVNESITKALPPAGTNALATSAFATYVLSLVGYGVYLLHGLLPPETVRSTLMISYFPSQVWATILPAWLTVAFWYLFLVYFATNLSKTPPIHGPDGLASITDHAALILDPDTLPRSPPQNPPSHDQPVPILRDLPCQVVNQFYFD